MATQSQKIEKKWRFMPWCIAVIAFALGLVAAGCAAAAQETAARQRITELAAALLSVRPQPAAGFSWLSPEGTSVRISTLSTEQAPEGQPSLLSQHFVGQAPQDSQPVPDTGFSERSDGFLLCSMVYREPLPQLGHHGELLEIELPLSGYAANCLLWFFGTAGGVVALAILRLVSAREQQTRMGVQIESLVSNVPLSPGGPLNMPPAATSPADFALLRKRLRSLNKRIDQQLSRAEGKAHSLQLMVDSMKEGVLMVDRLCQIRAINPSAREFFGLENEEDETILGTPLLEKIRSSELHALWESILENRNPAEMELVLYRVSPVSLHVSASWLHSPKNGEEGVLFVLSDISTLKRLEGVRTEFVANVSHELRTPVTALKGFAETLLDGGLEDPESARHFVGIMLRQAERLQAIIDDLLMLSRLEQSGGKIPREPGSLNELVHNALEVCRPNAAQRATNIEVTVPALDISVNRHLVEQAIINLVENAVKYSPEGSVVRVDGGKEAEGWYLSVSDNGPGIPLRDQERLFERFYRIDRARSRSMGGTGLGLSIVRHIALVHGGSVSLESTSGQGARFTLHFPGF